MWQGGSVMWTPRIAVDAWTWFAVGYLMLLVTSASGLVWVLTRLRARRSLMTRWAAAWVSGSVVLFMWLVGAPMWLALMLGVGIVPVVLVVLGGTESLSRGDDGDVDGR